ncbi:MAG TPA: sugar transferase [Candidatus Polarisedimenticolia bacterium]
MNYPDRRVFRLLILLLDLCALVGAFHLAVETRLGLNAFYGYQMTRDVVDLLTPPLGLILLLWIPMSRWVSLYRPRRGGILAGSAGQIVESVAAVAMLTILATFFIRSFGAGFSRTFVVFFSAYSMATLMAARLILWAALGWCQKRGYAQERIAIVGAGPDTKALAEHFESAGGLGLTLCGVIAAGPESAAGALGNPVPVLGTIEEVGALINRHRLDRIIAVAGEIDRMGLQRLAATCTRMGVPLNRLPFHAEVQAARLRVHEIGELSLLEVRGMQFTPAQEFIKRVFDIAAGSLMLMAAAPVMALLATAIKMTSRGPVLYLAPRTGRGGRHFPFYKFRSMVLGAEERRGELIGRNEKDGHLFKIKDDPRLTAVGRLMRRYSLDELPQLLNVLKGDMSLVGPRPLPASDLDQDGLSREHSFWAQERTRVLPGVTGPWQVRGRSDLGFEEMIRLDVAYVRDWSVWGDVAILARTLPAVLKGKGAC